jgi:hypothetical protein
MVASWRKGRCLPYGEGVTFWALGEVVKTQLGILESDARDEAERKLVANVEDTWIAENLRPLIGLADSGNRAATGVQKRSPRGVGSSQDSRRGGRLPSSSKTCIGPMMRCSTS